MTALKRTSPLGKIKQEKSYLSTAVLWTSSAGVKSSRVEKHTGRFRMTPADEGKSNIAISFDFSTFFQWRGQFEYLVCCEPKILKADIHKNPPKCQQ